MTLYVFNPEHDIALASGLHHFTAPRAGRQLRHDLGFLPSIWALKGDAVLVDDINLAEQKALKSDIANEGVWVTPKTVGQYLKQQNGHIEIQPWGWDAPLVSELSRMGCSSNLLPNDRQLEDIRQMSHRDWANEHLLRELHNIPGLIGQAWAVTGIKEIENVLTSEESFVVKAPWSSSGRGVRTIAGSLTDGMRGWIEHVIAQQGCIMLEPYYQKVMDLGLEFMISDDGKAQEEGLSLFDTTKGAYTGNRIDREEDKEKVVCQFITVELWQTVKEALAALLEQQLANRYHGRLGIDMMIVETDEGLRLHPCVEMNLRTTMGHVALQLHRRYGLRHHTMQISFDGHYHLSIKEKNEDK